MVQAQFGYRVVPPRGFDLIAQSSEDSKATAPPRVAKQAESAPKFSIGLGTLSPSYSQKFGNDGSTKLDFNSEKDGYSFSLSNVNHPTTSHQPNNPAKVSIISLSNVRIIFPGHSSMTKSISTIR